MPDRIMAHMVAFYPDRENSIEVARALIDGGCNYLEVQFPFSDPTADGVYIQKACMRALEKGFKVYLGFSLISSIRKCSSIPIFIMGYANTVFFHGVEKFLKKCVFSGVQGLIIPDLPPGYDEDIFALGKKAGLKIIPVIAPSIKDDRLDEVMSRDPEYVYAVLRKGITGAYTKIGEDNISFLKKVGVYGIKILAGFGITEKKQVRSLSPHVHASVVGTAFIKEIMNNYRSNPYKVITGKMRGLL